MLRLSLLGLNTSFIDGSMLFTTGLFISNWTKKVQTKTKLWVMDIITVVLVLVCVKVGASCFLAALEAQHFVLN